MTSVLLVTVGGSPEPILQAVKDHAPEELIFICSAPPCKAPSLTQVIGEGTPCRHTNPDGSVEWKPNLVTQLQLTEFRPDEQILELPDPDDLADIHRRIGALCRRLEERFSAIDLHGDPSGGTKAMSAALAMVLLEQNASISLVSGERSNLVRIERSEGSRSISVGAIRARQLLLDQLPPLLDRHLYDQASVLLTELRRLHQGGLNATSLDAISELRSCLAVLMRWDRFEWQAALQQAADTTSLQQHFPNLRLWWQRVDRAHLWLVQGKVQKEVTGYELVQDLLLNAERRGRRGWYDDAVARLYRALELLAQTYIQLEKGYHHQDFWDHPDIQQDRRDWDVRRGVSGLYFWLGKVERDRGLGGAAARQWAALLELLNARNQSLLGHGLKPISQSDWQSLQSRVSNLVVKALEEVDLPQGPPPEQLPGALLLNLPAAKHLLDGTP